jgi:hypothetical protein
MLRHAAFMFRGLRCFPPHLFLSVQRGLQCLLFPKRIFSIFFNQCQCYDRLSRYTLSQPNKEVSCRIRSKAIVHTCAARSIIIENQSKFLTRKCGGGHQARRRSRKVEKNQSPRNDNNKACHNVSTVCMSYYIHLIKSVCLSVCLCVCVSPDHQMDWILLLQMRHLLFGKNIDWGYSAHIGIRIGIRKKINIKRIGIRL